MTKPPAARIRAAVLRHFRHASQRHWSFAIVALLVALSARLVVPVGYMPTMANSGVVMALCTGQGSIEVAVADAAPGLRDLAKHVGHDRHDGQAKAGPCGFAGALAASLAAMDPILLALAILFIVATTFRQPAHRAITVPAFLWPPRTGPPVTA